MTTKKAKKTKDQSNPGYLVSVAWLKEHLSDADLRIIDLRWYLQGKKGIEEYNQGHIPGAIFLDLEKDLTAPGGPGRHPIPGPEQFSQAMSKAGVGKKTHVVVYDDAGGSIAARLWWLARVYYEHERISVLDGGLQAWTQSGGALSKEAPSIPAAKVRTFSPNFGATYDKWMVDAMRAVLSRKSAKAVLLDARVPERYRGEIEPIDARPGHIPGARNAPFTANLTDGLFKSPKELQVHYKALGVKKGGVVVCYCGSGVTACHDILAISMAFPGQVPLLYEGSWSDWARDSFRPAAVGESAE